MFFPDKDFNYPWSDILAQSRSNNMFKRWKGDRDWNIHGVAKS